MGDEVFTYDQAGNRLSDVANPQGSMVHDAANRLVRDSKHEYAYDGEGNQAARTVRATGATTRFLWNTEHQLVRVNQPGGGVVRYSYDPEGRRIRTTRADGSGRVFGFDGMYVAATWKIPPAVKIRG